jgi:hypothetical protein
MPAGFFFKTAQWLADVFLEGELVFVLLVFFCVGGVARLRRRLSLVRNSHALDSSPPARFMAFTYSLAAISEQNLLPVGEK